MILSALWRATTLPTRPKAPKCPRDRRPMPEPAGEWARGFHPLAMASSRIYGIIRASPSPQNGAWKMARNEESYTRECVEAEHWISCVFERMSRESTRRMWRKYFVMLLSTCSASISLLVSASAKQHAKNGAPRGLSARLIRQSTAWRARPCPSH